MEQVKADPTKKAEYMRLRRERRYSAGICQTCSRSRIWNKSCCKRCLARRASEAKQMRVEHPEYQYERYTRYA